MTELATPINALDAVKVDAAAVGAALADSVPDQATLDLLTGTVAAAGGVAGLADAVAAAAQLPQAQADLAAKQAELEKAQSQAVTILQAAGITGVASPEDAAVLEAALNARKGEAAVRAAIAEAERFHLHRVNDVLAPLLEAALRGKAVVIPTLAEDAAAFDGGGG